MNKMLKLDLSKPEHNAQFLKLYADLDIHNNNPDFHALYLRTVENHKKGVGLNYATYETEGVGFKDGIDLEFIGYNGHTKKLCVKGVTSLSNTAAFIDEFLEVYSVDGVQYSYNRKSQQGIRYADIETQFTSDINQPRNWNVDIVYTVVWFDPREGIMKTLCLRTPCFTKTYMNSFIEKVELGFPKHINTSSNEPITICYFRKPAEMTIDKEYRLVYRNDKPDLLLDVNGDVFFEEPTKNVFDFIKINTFELKVNCHSGFSLYRLSYLENGAPMDRSQEVINSFTATPTGFHIQLNEIWKDYIPTMSLPSQEEVDFSFRVEFQLKNKMTGVLSILSNAMTSASSNLQISKLKLLWGCLGKGSQIAMADGTQKSIEDIRIGDHVIIDYTQATAEVINTWEGTEVEPLILIEASDGSQIACTGSHPIITSKKIVIAANLEIDHFLINAAGAPVAVKHISTASIPNVYNLSLKPDQEHTEIYVDGQAITGTSFICNGLLVGDNEMQNSNFIDDEPTLDPIQIQESIIRQAFFEQHNQEE